MPIAQAAVAQELSTDYVRELFKDLESGDGSGFSGHDSDDVDWTVEGSHPLASRYHSRAEFRPRCSPFPRTIDFARNRISVGSSRDVLADYK